MPQAVLKEETVCHLFCIFEAFPILNGYLQGAQMKGAQNSGSESSVKKYNWTFTTDSSYKTLCIVFFGSPCIRFGFFLLEKDTSSAMSTSMYIFGMVSYHNCKKKKTCQVP